MTGKLQYINISTRPGMSDYKVERAIKEAFKKSPASTSTKQSAVNSLWNHGRLLQLCATASGPKMTAEIDANAEPKTPAVTDATDEPRMAAVIDEAAESKTAVLDATSEAKAAVIDAAA